MSFLKDILQCPAKKKYSMLRFLLLQGFYISIILLACGVVGWFLKLENAIIVISTGAGMLVADNFTKSIQAHAEKKLTETESEGL